MSERFIFIKPFIFIHLLICAIYSGLYKKVFVVFVSVVLLLSCSPSPFFSTIFELYWGARWKSRFIRPHLLPNRHFTLRQRLSAQGWSVFLSLSLSLSFSLSPYLYLSHFLQRCQGTCAVNVKRSPLKAFQKKPLCSRPHIGDCKTYSI